jgi:hypothetical protein|uniref:Uncharacterized protein n=1 Tax=Sipha flava TaxID=143950 RepID=A0A2S2PVQ3_9HEMI
MDFEFTSFRNSLVLISGAMSDHRMDSPVVKLRGYPLVLSRSKRALRLDPSDERELVRHLKRTMRRKSELLRSLLCELEIGVRTSRRSTTLYPEYVTDYMHGGGRQRPVLVLWNGSSDVEIMRRLRVDCPMIVNLTAYDEHGDKRYLLKLIDYGTNQLMCARYIGRFDKNGRMLSLSEAHSMVCAVRHDITYLHDPVVDVLYTKCVFNHLIRMVGHDSVSQLLADRYRYR